MFRADAIEVCDRPGADARRSLFDTCPELGHDAASKPHLKAARVIGRDSTVAFIASDAGDRVRRWVPAFASVDSAAAVRQRCRCGR